jgi:hypothetical protein
MTPLVWKTYHPTNASHMYGEQFFLRQLLLPYVREYEDFEADMDGAIVMIRANDNAEYIEAFNRDLSRLQWCVVMVTGNENASNFHEQIIHKNMRLVLQTPKYGDRADLFVPLGYPSNVSKVDTSKDLDWFFSGQVNHSRRFACVVQLRNMKNGLLNETAGFNQGFSYDEYIKHMSRAKIVPCPGGPATPDTFRLYEALECGCMPIVDSNAGCVNYVGKYWKKVFGFVPFQIIADWQELPRYTEFALRVYDEWMPNILGWWANYKRELPQKILTLVRQVS